MTFVADYPGAIVVQSRNYGYVVGGKHLLNNPKAWCLHTPEEPPDNVPSTPYYFASTTRNASTTYFVSYLGFVFQCVPESEGAYANAVEGKPYPVWAASTVNLNLQTLSIEIEGYAAMIHQTMPRGSPQWNALVNLMAHRCKALNIPPGRTFGHKEVSVYRSDPGQLNIPLLVTDVIAAMKGGEQDMPFLIHNAAGTYWEMCPGGFKKAIVFAALQAYDTARAQGKTPVTDVLLPDTVVNAIPDLPAPSTAQVDVNAIAKAVNDEAYRRQEK